MAKWKVVQGYEVKETIAFWMIREIGQTTECPHYSVPKTLASELDIYNGHYSDNRRDHYGMNEINIAAIMMALGYKV
jgi:hypothetical protein